MSITLSLRSLSYCTHVDPRLMAVVHRAAQLSTQDFGVTEEQSRTPAEQALKVARGVSKTMHTHHLINDGKGSASFMKTPPQIGFCGAIDLVAWTGSAYSWASWTPYFAIAAAMGLASVQLSTPLTWGGDWDRLLEELFTAGETDLAKIAAALEAAHDASGGFDAPHHQLGRN